MDAQVSTHVTLLNRLAESSDAAAWSEFLDRYGELMRGFAWRRSVQPNDCDDLLQEVMMSLAKAMPGFRYDPERGKFRSFLKTVVVRAIYRKFGQKRAEKP